MNAQPPFAEYPFSQAQLWKRCLELQPSLERDATALAVRGVTATRIADFKTTTTTFGNMEPDTVLVQEGAVVTDEKDAEQLALETAIQQVLGIIAVKDSPRTSRYKRFGVANVTALSESKLHLAATLLVKQGRKYLSEYTAEGLTEALLQAVEDCNAAFVDGLAERKEAENARRTATQARIAYANGLYRQLVQLCAAGESLYKQTDAARARDYVIDPVPQTGGPRPPLAEATA